MYIRMGSISNVVVSSPQMAKEILQKHGQVFTGRPDGQAMQVCDQSKLSVAFMPVGGEWRLLRKIMKEELFSHPSMEAGEGIRKQNLQQLVDYVQKCCDSGRAVAIREAASIIALNLISTTLFSTEAIEFDSEGIMELKELLQGATLSIGMPNLADYFPILKPFDPQGIKRKAEIYYGTLLRKVEAYLSERVESKNKHNAASKKHHDLMETLLDLVEGNRCGQLTLKHLAHLLKDLHIGGSGSTAWGMEWIMSELVLNPDVMAKVKAEVKSVAGDERLVKQSDIPRLPYLGAVIKEVMRLHPVAPFLFPRVAESDQMVNGYMIPKGTQILVNLRSIGKDPSIWKNPETFDPQRFIDQKIDYKGQDFELITFGSGRRICPGLPLADRILHITTATLVHNFDWKLDQGATDADQKGKFRGFAEVRAVSLKIIPLNT